MLALNNTFSSIHHRGCHSFPLPVTEQYEVIKGNQITSCSKQNNELTRAKAFKLVMDEIVAVSSDPTAAAVEVREHAEVTFLSSEFPKTTLD